MSIRDQEEDLSGHYHTERSKIINHPAFSKPVLLTQFGWAKRGEETHWYKQEIKPLTEETTND